MKTRLLLLFAALLCFAGTASAQMVTFYAGILEPATVTLPERITRIYLASRGGETQLHSPADVNAFKTLSQLKTILESTGRYVIEIAEIDAAYNLSANASAPALLDWKEVGRITNEDTMSLLIVLEKYQEYTSEPGVEMEQRLWRIYDFATQSLRDEFDHQCKSSRYSTAVLPAVSVYADRIMMHWEWVQRDYYKSGNARMKAAWHCLDSSDWNGATAKWKLVARDTLKDPKTAAKACYNMAMYCELEGDIAGAQRWIARSQRHGNVLAVYYGRILRERSGDTSSLNQQLANRQGQIPLDESADFIVSHRSSAGKLSGNSNFLERKPPLTAEQLERRRMHENPPMQQSQR